MIGRQVRRGMRERYQEAMQDAECNTDNDRPSNGRRVTKDIESEEQERMVYTVARARERLKQDIGEMVITKDTKWEDIVRRRTGAGLVERDVR